MKLSTILNGAKRRVENFVAMSNTSSASNYVDANGVRHVTTFNFEGVVTETLVKNGKVLSRTTYGQ